MKLFKLHIAIYILCILFIPFAEAVSSDYMDENEDKISTRSCKSDEGKAVLSAYDQAMVYHELSSDRVIPIMEKAYACFIIAAKEGVREAYLYLGYYNTRVTIPDTSYEKAFKYFTIYTEMGGEKAYGALGASYDYGMGVERDIEKAKYYYRKHIEYNGSIASRRRLAFIETMQDIGEFE